ncbi:MAG: Ig-like domain-containing protein [Myxococcota bacterium]|nr:Ig-like domain-containing protein [Myxococcota bacterium]
MSSVLLLAFVACNDNEVGVYNTPPSVSITSPEEGMAVPPGDSVELAGIARDDQQDPQTLEVTWASSVDGELGTAVPDASGVVLLPVTGLSPGPHVITLEAIDASGEAGRATVEIEVGNGENVPGSPVVNIIGPMEGDAFPASAEVNVVAFVEDDVQLPGELSCEIVSSRDGMLWTGSPAANGGVTQALTGLSIGAATLSLRCLDLEDKVGSATVGIEILEDARPTVTLTSPKDGANHWTTDTITLSATVGDDLTAPNALSLSFDSDLQGSLWGGAADSSGKVSSSFSLMEGTHTLTLRAVDEDGNEGSASAQVIVIDPDNYDNDGDGYTENMGDCDDGNPKVSPGEAEVCDGVDQDCDGDNNEDWWDSYEENESQAGAYDFGEVDGLLWSGDSLSVSGLTMSGPGDEDWFVFDVGDNLFESAYFTVQITSLPASGAWVAELYDLDNGSVLYTSASVSGGGVLRLTKPKEWGTDSDWALRIYPSSWVTKGCSQTYSLRIDAGADIIF